MIQYLSINRMLVLMAYACSEAAINISATSAHIVLGVILVSPVRALLVFSIIQRSLESETHAYSLELVR